MERLTKRSSDTTHENGICCANFLSAECHSVEGDCSAGCEWEETAWSRLADYEDTGLTPEEIKKIGMEVEAGCIKAIARMYGVEINRLRELAEADKDRRVVVLPCKVGELWRDQDTGRVVKITDVRYGMKWEDDTSVTYDYSDGSHGGALWDAFRDHFVRVDTEK